MPATWSREITGLTAGNGLVPPCFDCWLASPSHGERSLPVQFSPPRMREGLPKLEGKASDFEQKHSGRLCGLHLVHRARTQEYSERELSQ